MTPTTARCRDGPGRATLRPMAELDYTVKKPDETIEEYLARMPDQCPVCGHDPKKRIVEIADNVACKCGCHDAVDAASTPEDYDDDVGFHRGGPHPGDKY